MSDSQQKRWKIVSLVLMSALVVSLALNVYSTFFNAPVTQETSAPYEFDFAWGRESQKIVNDTFRLSIRMWLKEDNLTMIVTANDNEYDEYDYIGLVFDTNQNGYIDVQDQSYGLWASNRTVASALFEHGFLGFTQGMEVRGPQNVSFDARTGYTFNIEFPSYYPTKLEEPWYDPARAIKNGINPLHVCFYDDNATWSISPNEIQGVFSRFVFRVGR